MARTTLDIDPTVLAQLRRLGKDEGKSIGQVASETLARALAGPPKVRPPFRWTSADLGTPLVDLEDRDALWRILDGDG